MQAWRLGSANKLDNSEAGRESVAPLFSGLEPMAAATALDVRNMEPHRKNAKKPRRHKKVIIVPRQSFPFWTVKVFC
jgi:hypothetical protein